MAFKGITFAGQNVTPKNDGGLYQAHYGDGILWGCSMSLSGDDLVIQSGEFIAGGRVCFVDGATNVDLSGRVNTNGYIQVIMNYDLSQGEGLQWYTTFVESATTTFPALTTDDINDTGTLYQLSLAIVQVSGGNLTSIYSTMGYSRVISGAGASLNGTLDMTLSNGGFINFRDGNNDINSRIRINSTGNIAIGYYDNGDIANGFYAYNDGRAIVYADGNDICLRPNGSASTVGEVKVDSTGQQIGGHPIISKSKTTATSIPAGISTVTNLTSITGLDSSGVYLIVSYLTFALTTAPANPIQCRMIYGTSASGVSVFDRRLINGTADWMMFLPRIISGVTAQYLNFGSANAGSVSSAYMYAVRLA